MRERGSERKHKLSDENDMTVCIHLIFCIIHAVILFSDDETVYPPLKGSLTHQITSSGHLCVCVCVLAHVCGVV